MKVAIRQHRGFVMVRHAIRGGHKLSFVWSGLLGVIECKLELVYTLQDLSTGKRETVYTRRLPVYRAHMDGKHVS